MKKFMKERVIYNKFKLETDDKQTQYDYWMKVWSNTPVKDHLKPKKPADTGKKLCPVIDVENHFMTPVLMEHLMKMGSYCGMDLDSAKDAMEFIEKVAMDAGAGRLANMDAAGVDYAHISLTTPGSEMFEEKESKEVASKSNDSIAAAIKANPDRIGGWIALATKDPKWCVKEIDRCMDMGMWGVNILSNLGDSYIDEKIYWPIFEKCEELDMPIYIHPNESTIKDFNEFGYCISGPSFGFTVDTQYCIMRMIHRGVFDAYPDLKVMTGHFAEAFPFLKNRVDTAWRQGLGKPNPAVKSEMKHEPSYYLEHNIWATSSGNFLPEALYCSVGAFGKDKVLLSTDYPYENFKESVDFIKNDKKISDDEKKHILYKNAKSLGFAKDL